MTTPAYSSAVEEASCPRCDAKPGADCTRPLSGRRVWPPHAERVEAYRAAIGDEAFRQRHTLTISKPSFL